MARSRKAKNTVSSITKTVTPLDWKKSKAENDPFKIYRDSGESRRCFYK